MKPTEWSRVDQAGLEIILLGTGCLAVLGLVPAVVRAVRGAAIEVSTELPDRLTRTLDGVRDPVTGTVVLTDPTAGQQVLHLLPQALFTALAVAVVVLLLGVARTVRAGDPFAPANRRRLLWVAGLVAVGGTVVQGHG